MKKFDLKTETQKLQNEIDKIYPGKNLKVKVLTKNKLVKWVEEVLGIVCFYGGIVILIQNQENFLMSVLSLSISAAGLELLLKNLINKYYNPIEWKL